MQNKLFRMALLSTALVATSAAAQDATLTIESWRNDDLALWQEQIIPAFEAEHPGIKINFTPSAPTEYNAVLNSKLEAGSAGDLITCRPFDASLALYDAGHLADLSDMEAMSNFSDVAKSAWQTDDGCTRGDAQRLLATAERVMARRDIALTTAERTLFTEVERLARSLAAVRPASWCDIFCQTCSPPPL